MPRICRENDLGPIEYKRELKNMIESKIKKYATQMKFRLIEGSGTAYYLIGVKDDGEIIGVTNIYHKLYCKLMNKICKQINSKITKVEFIGEDIQYMKFTIESRFNISDIYKF